MTRQRLGRAVWLAWGLVLGLGGCDREVPPQPLGADEQALVQAYVRVAVLQALQAGPDSSAAAWPQLGASVDTAAVQRALSALSRDSLRWEIVYAAIAARLEELEEDQENWWNVVRGDSLRRRPGTGPARLPIESTGARDR